MAPLNGWKTKLRTLATPATTYNSFNVSISSAVNPPKISDRKKYKLIRIRVKIASIAI